MPAMIGEECFRRAGLHRSAAICDYLGGGSWAVQTIFEG